MSGITSERIALILLLTDEGASSGLIAHFQRLYMANTITSEEHKALNNMYISDHPSKWTLKNKLSALIYKIRINQAFSSSRASCQLN